MIRLFVLLISFLISVPGWASLDSVLGRIPVQDGGRFKPFDTFSRETVQLVYGRRDYKGKSATEIVMTWLLLPEHWDSIEFVKVERKDLKEALQLTLGRSHFSPAEILKSDRLPLLLQDLQGKRKSQEKLNPYWQAVQTLESQISMYKGVVAGAALKMVPKKEGEAWLELREVSPEMREKFDGIAKAFVTALESKDEGPLNVAVDEFIAAARAENPGQYPKLSVIALEHFYNVFHPFQWAWILYLISILLILGSLGLKKEAFWKAACVAAVLGFLIHTFGFGLRMVITGRAPVSNMYESVIWVSWGALVFAAIFEFWMRKKIFLLSSAVIGVICLIIADIAPTVLDPSLQPLQPVLRSNYWLTIHVLTITLSYSAFFLAFIMGDIGLGYYLAGETRHAGFLSSLSQGIYRVLQVGVALLFAGTVLGGIWADYSWGRFWGWDPKETWAFIAFLGYLAILHARLSGLIKTFGFIASSVVAFSLVLMAWYGVNFVLGAGLHSYGFGAGGVEYVTAFVVAHFAFVIFVATVRQSRGKRAQ